MECTLCKIQCVVNAEVPFNIWLNNCVPDVSEPNAIPGSRHFVYGNHNISTHAKFCFIEKITTRNKPMEIIQDILIKRKNFWISMLETLYP